jgi:hypothetical protein
MAWRIRVPLDVPSGNRSVGAASFGRSAKQRAFVNRRAYKRLRGDAETLLRAAKALARIPDATGKRRITWTRILGKGQRTFDESNFVQGLKPIADSASAVGLILDDKPKCYEGRYPQDDTRRGAGPALELLSEDIEAEGA